ncbi:MAG: hypothetical protein K6360_09025, partial [Deltaproteobacteria bacterium]
IPLKKPEMQGAKFSRNEEGESRFAPTASAAWAGKLKQRRENRFFSAGSYDAFILYTSPHRWAKTLEASA